MSFCPRGGNYFSHTNKTKFPLTSKVKFLGTLNHRYDPEITVNAPELSLNDLAL